MSLPAIAFYGFSALAIGAALTILFTRNVMYAALCLFLTLLGVAALFVLQGADFLAVTQLLVYVGGVLVLLIFGIMLTHRRDSTPQNVVRTTHLNQVWGGVVGLGMLALLVWIIANARFGIIKNNMTDLSAHHSTLRRVGIGLMTDYVWAFEIIGILLLVALVGASYLAAQQINKQRD
jgi:NADH-quinone oxidoreductase subunit J